jgi:8-oxo-dGTP diphosphatase
MAAKIVVAVITRDDMVLLVRRRRVEGELSWVFPGGTVEPGETEIQAVEREVREEVGLKVRACTKLGQRVHPDTGRLLAYWVCEPMSGDGSIVDAEELDLLTWVTPSEAIAMIVTSLYPPVREHLESLPCSRRRSHLRDV